jgi:hypothetical protein
MNNIEQLFPLELAYVYDAWMARTTQQLEEAIRLCEEIQDEDLLNFFLAEVEQLKTLQRKFAEDATLRLTDDEPAHGDTEEDTEGLNWLVEDLRGEHKCTQQADPSGFVKSSV